MTEFTYQEPLLTLSNVSRQFEGELVLRDINLQVRNITRPGIQQGQVVGFYGRSGLGKSVLSRILAGLLPPSTGTVEVGTPAHPVRTGDVGFVQQRYPLFNHRTLLDNLLVAAARKHPAAEAQARAESFLERFGLAAHRRKFPAMLSGGQRQRAAIAQQLLCSEHFIILDEPFSGLDIAMIDEVKKIIVEVTTLHDLNTVIIVSHDLTTTTAISDTLWLLAPERDAAGQCLPGATITEKHQYNLAQMGLAWQPGIEGRPKFAELVQHLKNEIRQSL
ncbi:ATP-binding cassette domain-containing protein [Hymenobacter cheonanensis]|uniref:ATP-binding cassette domain-containing protein n=1 Tax=Hymenobacter sp. CA2-7 TaxID=3063993 RepID=UPI0027132EAC|nr:ATP-binding cassette domain-containing protein [Hymenobacter sp. CA2-7]MDO7887095.1 ATP-binding cassette domain-containing protein [Hymenobacter sp. CA2-7]